MDFRLSDLLAAKPLTHAKEDTLLLALQPLTPKENLALKDEKAYLEQHTHGNPTHTVEKWVPKLWNGVKDRQVCRSKVN